MDNKTRLFLFLAFISILLLIMFSAFQNRDINTGNEVLNNHVKYNSFNNCERV